MRWQEKAGYRIPQINNLRGKKGRKFLEAIRNLPPSDFTELKKKVDKYVQDALEKREINSSKIQDEKHKRVSSDEYIKMMKEYVENLEELSKTNPELAKQKAQEALIKTGVLDVNGNEKENIVTSYKDDQKSIAFTIVPKRN